MVSRQKDKRIINDYAAAYVWLALPTMAFCATWLRAWIGWPMVALMLVGLWLALRPKGGLAAGYKALTATRRQKVVIVLLVVGWVVFSGIGGYMWQDRWDHQFRNAIFFDLYNYAWPVVNGSDGGMEMLCYYFGFWLPPTLIAKWAHSMEVGFACQLIYALIGVGIAIKLMFRKLGGVRIVYVLAFFVFGGLDIVAWLLYRDVSWIALIREMKDLSYGYFSSPSATIQLYFIYNQGIAAWIAILLLLKEQESRQTMMFAYSLLLIFSPIVSLALAPWVGIRLLQQAKMSVSVANVIGLMVCLLMAAFYTSSQRTQGFAPNEYDGYYWLMFVSFIALTYAVIIPFVWKELKGDSTFWIFFATMCVVSMFNLNERYDLAWRCSIPTTFVLMLAVFKRLGTVKRSNLRRNAAFLMVLAIGAFSNVCVFLRNGYHEMEVVFFDEPVRSTKYDSTFTIEEEIRYNFVSRVNPDGFFYRMLLREPDEKGRGEVN